MDLVGLISKGIDRLVDKKVVGGVRPETSSNPATPQLSPAGRGYMISGAFRE